ncbi:MAG: hypothetical protein DRN04_19315 [Thermoprotei archaeon]|nr:MAG: hypothetical protein DRN04_19315 [Thermoprotei archaeon]
MGESYKILGGIGYILSLIPFINFIGGILAGIGWLGLGKKTGDGVFKATGVLMIISSILGLGLLIAVFSTMGAMPTVGSPEEIMGILAGLTVTLIIIGCVAAVIGIVMFILQVVSFFRAGKKFNNGAFKAAGWLSIVFVLLAIIGVVILIVAVFSIAGGAPEEQLGLSLIGSIGMIVLGLVLGVIVNILAAVGFFTLKVEVAPLPPATYPYYQPPPPPPPSYQFLH